MPHPERVFLGVQHTWVRDKMRELNDSPWQRMFDTHASGWVGESVSSKVDYKSAVWTSRPATRRCGASSGMWPKPISTSFGSAHGARLLWSALCSGRCAEGMKHPVMVQSTDGVGTKSKVTVMAGRYEELGMTWSLLLQETSW